jgi:catechol 2,3-dioxygenase
MALAQTVQNLIDAGYLISGTADHGVSEAIYLNDPDGIGVELYADRPRDQWKVKNDGELEMVTEPLDVANLLNSLKRG